MLRRFKEEFSQCRFEVRAEDTPKCLQMLTLGEVDLAITLEPIKMSDVEFIPCFTDELRMVIPVDHRWAKTGKVDWNELLMENFILYNRESYTFRILNDYLDGQGLKLSSFMEINSPEAAKELIKVSMGIGVMADWAVEKEANEGELISLPLGRKKLLRTWGISVRKGRKLNKAERIFIKIAEESGCHWMVNRRLG